MLDPTPSNLLSLTFHPLTVYHRGVKQGITGGFAVHHPYSTWTSGQLKEMSSFLRMWPGMKLVCRFSTNMNVLFKKSMNCSQYHAITLHYNVAAIYQDMGASSPVQNRKSHKFWKIRPLSLSGWQVSQTRAERVGKNQRINAELTFSDCICVQFKIQ